MVRLPIFYLSLSKLDGDFPLVSITSFNEWHEDTQIEPTIGTTGATSQDSSATGFAYTQDQNEDDYGLQFLELIRDAVLAVTGTIRGPAGPLAGARIEVLDGNAVAAEKTSFSTGNYAISRRSLASGKSYRLLVTSPGLPAAVSGPFTVSADRAVTGFDISLLPKVSRGDCNGDAAMNIADATRLLNYLFKKAIPPDCLEACDVNADRGLDVSDAVYLLLHFFKGAQPPRFPSFPACEPLANALGCPEGNC